MVSPGQPSTLFSLLSIKVLSHFASAVFPKSLSSSGSGSHEGGRSGGWGGGLQALPLVTIHTSLGRKVVMRVQGKVCPQGSRKKMLMEQASVMMIFKMK